MEAERTLGIIGVGEIAHAIVSGLCDGTDVPPAIALSPRGARTAAELAERHENVRVCPDNQAVADAADVLILAVRPQQRAEALAPLTVRPGTLVISAVAGTSVADVGELLGHDGPVVRVIPLPAVSRRSSITVTYPAHPVAEALFDRLGGALVAPAEEAFDVFSALTSTFTSYYAYLATLADWGTRQGIDGEAADRYVRGLFENAAHALTDASKTLPRIAAGHETPGGINERIRTTWYEPHREPLERALDALLADLKRGY
ncbi:MULTISPECIES: NAD(P)-binding domain-containing protein [Streptomyces]|uniref:NAD(P)-binding domain-containing protein n=1 Tax=Streptomyces TaxID=1883 RepID=UPI0007465E4C|nr:MULTISPECIES: NAD(P)-binding domain-containing protein [Streptomyces]KUL47485.1 aromatic ring-opening dioxygenase LigA [Streptomyces sp. NRRL S-1521]QUI30114.1 NAD(P)-binding domain-containing protein [Streptomyces alfalfae]THC55258.1 pyrroline-5-carboxylate reductase [Streptomyces sp. A1499]